MASDEDDNPHLVCTNPVHCLSGNRMVAAAAGDSSRWLLRPMSISSWGFDLSDHPFSSSTQPGGSWGSAASLSGGFRFWSSENASPSGNEYTKQVEYGTSAIGRSGTLLRWLVVVAGSVSANHTEAASAAQHGTKTG